MKIKRAKINFYLQQLKKIFHFCHVVSSILCLLHGLYDDYNCKSVKVNLVIKRWKLLRRKS